MTAAEVLRAARERISDPERWTTGTFALDADRLMLEDPRDERACAWCAGGAVFAVTGANPFDSRFYPGGIYVLAAAAEALTGRRRCDPTETVASFNDTHAHGDVLRLFDKAIAKAEAA